MQWQRHIGSNEGRSERRMRAEESDRRGDAAAGGSADTSLVRLHEAEVQVEERGRAMAEAHRQ